jgi:hypothetical protein
MGKLHYVNVSANLIPFPNTGASIADHTQRKIEGGKLGQVVAKDIVSTSSFSGWHGQSS